MTLLDIVERERRKVARHLGVASTAWIIAGVLVVLLVGTLLLGDARWLGLPRIAPFVVWLVILGGGWFAVRGLRRRTRQEASVATLARAVEDERRLRAGSLRGVLEVANSGTLGRLGAEQMAAHLHAIPDQSLVPQYRKRLLRRAGIAVLASAAGVLAMVTAATAAPDGFRAVLHPLDAWRGTLLGSVALHDVPRSVLRGESLTLSVYAPGRRQVQLAERVTGSSWRTRTITLAGDSAAIRLGPLDADVTLFATDGRSTSDTLTVRVVDRPFVGDVTVRAEFPAYLGRRAETLPLGELVRVPRGTSLAIEGHSSTELQQVQLTRNGAAMPLTVHGRSFAGQLVATVSGEYTWTASGPQGAIEDLPAPLVLDVLPDSAPQIEIISPSSDSLVSPNDTISVSVLATDDHGLAGVQLRVVVASATGEVRSQTMRAMSGPGTAQFAGDQPLATSALRPGDAMRVTAIATDASPWRQVGSSRELVLRYPTLAEQRDAARAAADSAVDKATAAANAQKQLNRRTEDAARARAREAEQKGADAMSYEASQQAQQFAKEQRQLADRMQQVQQAARELEKQLREAGALDSALQDRLREAQRLMREALTPELAEKLRQLEEASKDMSPQDSRRALQDLAEQQRRLREQLDKSVEMLKRAALEGSMETLKEDAKDLAKRQRDLVDSLRKADEQAERNAAEQLAQELSSRAKDLQKDVADLKKRLEQQQAEAGTERVQEAGEKIDESLKKLQEAMQERGQQQGQQQQGDQQGQRQQGQQQQGQQQQQGNAQQNQQGQRGQGEQKAGGDPQKGERQQGQQQQQQGQQGQQQKAGETGAQGQQQAQDKSGPGNQGSQKGEQSSSQAAEQAARSMEQAADELSKAREQQIGEWKKELSGELDRSIQEMLQLARQQDQLEQSARAGGQPSEIRAQQSALQQGVDKAMQRLQEAGQKSNLLSQRSMRMMSDARQKVEQATRQAQQAQSGQQMASAMRESSESLNQAAASLVRDRERTQNAKSATGFQELLEQMQEMARQQQGINSAMQSLMPKPGQQLSQQGQADSRQLARQQREVAARLEDASDRDGAARAEEMAREARQIAQQLESAQLDPGVLERQQRLFRKMLDAGRLLEEEEREDTGKREATPWTGSEVFTPSGANATGKAATKFTPPTWNDLRGLTSEERRLVLEYFKRINAKP
jgi:hypothetical protein